MKTEKQESYELHKLSKQHLAKQKDNSKRSINNNKAAISLSTQVFQVLDWWCRYLNSGQCTQIQQESIDELQQMLIAVHQRMVLSQLHNIQYANRIYYISTLIKKHNFKSKQWNLLSSLLHQQFQRVEQVYLNTLSNCQSLKVLKSKYKQKTTQEL